MLGGKENYETCYGRSCAFTCLLPLGANFKGNKSLRRLSTDAQLFLPLCPLSWLYEETNEVRAKRAPGGLGVHPGPKDLLVTHRTSWGILPQTPDFVASLGALSLPQLHNCLDCTSRSKGPVSKLVAVAVVGVVVVVVVS